MSTRTLAAALAPGLLLALALYAGEAAAQNACRGDAHTGSTSISCTEVAGSSADILVDPGSVNIPRIHVDHRGSGDITVRMKTGTLTGSGGNSILAERRGPGAASIEVSGGSLTNDVFITTGNTATGDLSIGMSGGSLSGRLNINRNGGMGNGRITVSGDATIRQTQTAQFGVGVVSNGLGDELSIRMIGGSVEATGASSAGLFLRSTNNNAAAAAAMTAVIEGGSVRTRGSDSSGVWFSGISGSRDASFRMTGGSIVTEADNSRGVYFALGRFGTGQTASVRMTGGSIVAEGLGSHGLSALAVDLGSVDAMTDAGATIATPFAVGMEGRLTQDASATGRLVFAHGGAVEARDVGVLAWARRSSGHTMGAGAQTADDAARAMPMIHVTSSGDVTVGASVTDAFIRARITGEDGTLSAAEQAVLSAITAGDSDALTTALAALPDADYDADWKAEAEDLRRKRATSSAAPTGNGPLAQQAGEEILGLSRAGVRAYALSHTAIVDYVRAGNALSDAERAALDAVLTKGVGSELETALTALTGATYTAAWKDTVRRFAATYNAGDIQVDVTGGTIDAEGNGVEALYAVLHERNGAITVTVAEGARIVGGANGVHVRGGGATGGVRNQRVTVNGRVTGGTGAGVYLGGGGTVSVGASGEVGATSDVGILADGGDLRATVSGTVTGDVRVNGGGDLTANVMAGGVVTGTVHDPVGPLTVAGSIGRLLYTNGGTVTVARTGALTGVEGETQAIRSEAGTLDLTVSGRVAGDLHAPSGGTLKLAVREGGKVPGTVHDPVGPLTVAGSIGRLLYTNGGTVTVARTGALTGVEGETEALRSEAGDLDVTVAGRVTGDLRAQGGGNLDATVSGTVDGDIQAQGDGALTLDLKAGGAVAGTVHDPVGPLTVAGSIGRLLYTSGGAVTVAATGALTGIEVEGETQAIRSEAGTLDLTVSGRVAGDLRAPSGGTLKLSVLEGGKVPGTVHDPVGPLTVAGEIGRLLYTNGGTVTVARTGALTGIEAEGETQAIRSEAGTLDLTVSGRVAGDLHAPSGGTLKLAVREGGKVPGTVHDPVGPLTVAGSIGRLLYTNGGAVTVAATGALTGVEVGGKTEALRSEAGNLALSVAGMGTVTGDVRARGDGDLRATVAGTLTGDLIEEGDGDLSATVSGTVDGDIQAQGDGALTLDLKAGGAVTGTVHDPVGPLTVAGSIGRLLYTSGGAVTVAATGALTGVEVGGKTEALRSEAGNLALSVAGMGTVTGDVRARGDGDLRATVAGTLTGDLIEEGDGDLSATVSGTVDGDIQAQGDGALTLDLKAGGAVTGTVHDPVGPLTVAGSIGRLLYTSGGAVTVAATGALTGIEAEGETQAIRSEAGTLDLTVSGRVAGDLHAPSGGTLKLSVLEGGKVPGTVHDPAGPLTVAGEIGRLLYTNGGTVTVARTGALTGIEVEGETDAICSEGGTQAICSAAGDLDLRVAGSVTGDVRAEGDGDLAATISGTLTGDILGLGAGEHVVTVSNGGTVTGTVHLAASTVGVDGRAGRVRFDNGGTVTVGGAGHITGIAVEDRTEAIRNEAGGLVVSVADGGRITGDVIDLGTRPARVTTGPGSRVEGSIDMAGAGSELRVDGTVEGNVRYRRGGMVTVGRDGRIEGKVSSDRGELVAVVERKPEETRDEARARAFPGGVVEGDKEEGGGRMVEPEVVELAREHEPRMRVYEALPSVVLGLNGLRGYGERMAAPRSAQGGWARVDALRGKWEADTSTSGVKYRHRRHGVEVGWGGALGEEARIGASLHHRRGTAKVTEGGDVELYGTGAGVSGTWTREEDYLDVQAAMTWYEADLTSSSRGVLRKDLSGHGHALGVEAGRRMALEHLPAGVVLTPRVGLVHSRVSMDAFSDATGARVSVDDARSLRGRAGVDVETKPGGAAGSRVFASVEVEHEFSTDRKVRVSETELESEAEATWLRLGLNGVHTWEEGRYTVQGGVGYATSGGSHELGGGVSLNLRF